MTLRSRLMTTGLAAGCALALFAAHPANAFDCAKAKTAVEKAICDDPALKRLDDELAQAYLAVKEASAPGEQKMLVQSQKRWIARRENCGDSEEGVNACVARETGERLGLLAGEPASGPGTEGKLAPLFIVQDGTAERYDIDIAVLRFPEPASPGEETLNRLADEVTDGVTLGPHGEDTGGAIYAKQDTFSLTYASPGLISVRHDFYVNEGGAHGNYGTANHNIDMASGRVLTIGDVLSEPSAAILSLWCKKQIEAEKLARMPDIDLEEDRAARDETIANQVRDLASWSIGEQEIVVHFDPYAVGSYAEGAYECSFPTKGVKRMALEGALLP